MSTDYIRLNDLNAYKRSREFSGLAWSIYSEMDWRRQKIIGDQFIRSVDSVGANIAEGYGRYHYLDKNKFYYNARGSLRETDHWCSLLYERDFIDKDTYNKLLQLINQTNYCINGLIKSQIQKKGG